MPSIHFIERLENVHRVPGESAWESGFWSVTEDAANRLVGGDLYLHRNQVGPSHFGGRIMGWRVHRDPSKPEIDGRLVFVIEPTLGHKGVRTQRAGWGNEKKFVW